MVKLHYFCSVPLDRSYKTGGQRTGWPRELDSGIHEPWSSDDSPVYAYQPMGSKRAASELAANQVRTCSSNRCLEIIGILLRSA